MRTRPQQLAALWHRIVSFGFRLLYNELAWLYDPVSWLASLGNWRNWQQTIWSYLPAQGSVLEVGCGPGHVLVALSRAGYRVVGLDLSPAMLRIARRGLRQQGQVISLCHGKASSLPFPRDAFDAVVITFPTSFAYDSSWSRQLVRVLRVGGRVITVEMASFENRSLATRCLEWLYRITGQRGPLPDLPQTLRLAGLDARREKVEVGGTRVTLTVAHSRESRSSSDANA